MKRTLPNMMEISKAIKWSKSWNRPLLIALLLVLGNMVLNHYYAPLGIFMSPAVTVIAVIVVNSNKTLNNNIILAIVSLLLVILNDVGIKLWSEGIHDMEGAGVVNLLFIFNSVVCLLTFSFLALNKGNSRSIVILTAAALYIVLACTYLYFFGWLGINQSY